jgi:hypothetical protein
MDYLTGWYLVLARFGDLPIGTRVRINQRSGIKTAPRPVSREAVAVRPSLKGMVWNWLEEGLWEHWRSICDFEAVEVISLP